MVVRRVGGSRAMRTASMTSTARSTAVARHHHSSSSVAVASRRETHRRSTVAPKATADETGENAAIVNTVKAIFGAGGFAIPWAFAQGGLVLVGSTMLASLVFALEALRMLIKSQDVLVSAGDATAAEVATYAGLTERAMGAVGDATCRVMNVVTCFGITVSYLIFIAETMKVVVPALGMTAHGATPTTAAMLSVIGPLMIGLSWLREMSGVAVISAVGTASVLIGMGVTMAVALGNPLQFGALPVSNFAAFPGFFGTVAFLFFIHFTLFSIKEAMPRPEKFFSAATKAFASAASIAFVFGVVGAAGFGPSVSSVVVTMLSGPVGVAVQLLLCLNLLSTYPIMAQSALRISENIFADKTSGTVATPVSLGVRTAFTAFALWTAANVPNFGVVLGYVGGVCCSILSLVLPATILYLAQKKVGNEITSNELARIATVFVTGCTCVVLSVVL